MVLRMKIDEYFKEEPEDSPDCEKLVSGGLKQYVYWPYCRDGYSCSDSSLIRADIRVFLRNHKEAIRSGRALAKIFHGISSPAYPLQDW